MVEKRPETELYNEIIVKLKKYFSSQITVALILGVFYSIAFYVIDLSPSILLGLSLGFLTFIPLVGPFFGFLICLIAGGVQFSTWGDIAWMEMGIIVAIYFVGQFLEGYFLTPKLVGKGTGLHPFFVFLSIFAGGAVFGILGMFLAVPIALVTIAVLRYIKERKQLSKGVRS